MAAKKFLTAIKTVFGLVTGLRFEAIEAEDLPTEQTGTVGFGGPALANVRVTVYTGDAGYKGLVVRKVAGQLSRILEVQADDGTDLLAVEANGVLHLVSGLTVAAGVFVELDELSANLFHPVRFNPTPTPVDIAAGVITASGMNLLIDTEGGGASDDLDTITAGGAIDGDVIIIGAANAARTVVVKHATGNIRLAAGADFTMDTDRQTMMLRCRGSEWQELSRSDNL